MKAMEYASLTTEVVETVYPDRRTKTGTRNGLVRVYKAVGRLTGDTLYGGGEFDSRQQVKGWVLGWNAAIDAALVQFPQDPNGYNTVE